MKFILAIISYLLSLIPRSKKILVFSSFPDYTDNAYAVYQYLQKNRGEKYKYVWIFSDKASTTKHSGVKGYYKYSIRAFYYFVRAKYVFCTHGIYSFLNIKQKEKIVNLWHGMPLKTIGCMDAQSGGSNPTKADYLIATSPFFQEIMAKSFNDIPLDKVLLTGQPRNDMLFEASDFYKNRGIDVEKYSSIGMWLPTYKQSIVGDIRVDGVYNDNGISFLSMDELSILDKHLQKANTLLIVKLHPMDALQKVNFSNFKNLMIVKPKDFNEQLYPLLGTADFLLTDYSSVWIDYCILKRPIGFVMNDIQEYKTSRGITIENLDEKLPGTIIDTLEKLLAFIEKPISNTDNIEFYNTHCDNRASERIVDYFNL